MCLFGRLDKAVASRAEYEAQMCEGSRFGRTWPFVESTEIRGRSGNVELEEYLAQSLKLIWNCN